MSDDLIFNMITAFFVISVHVLQVFAQLTDKTIAHLPGVTWRLTRWNLGVLRINLSVYIISLIAQTYPN